MKIAVGSSQATSNIQSSGKSFGIQANGKAFKILSSQLYNYKILAVIREISCNARDAHAMSNKLDQPFHVRLPSNDNLHFTVRDFGPGLSPENVMGMYTTYFHSTKSESNVEIGGLGLGSKSPLSYTTSFQVISYHNGLKTTFLAFQNDNGEPDIYQLSQTEISLDDTGLEVIVPVNESDIRRFRSSAETVYRFFDVPPMITSQGSIQRPYNEVFPFDKETELTREVAYEGNKLGKFYRLQDGQVSEISSDSTWAKMGDVIYPVAIQHVFDMSKVDEREIALFFKEARFKKLIIQCEIGELDINAGREGLSYDKATVGRLKTILSTVYGKLIQEANAEIASCSHYDVAVRETRKFVNFFGENAQRGMFSWRGNKVDIRTMNTFPQMALQHPAWNTMLERLKVVGGGNGIRYALVSNIRGESSVRQITGANINRLGFDLSKIPQVVIVDEPINGSKGSLKDRLEKKFTYLKMMNNYSVVVIKVSNVVTNIHTKTESATCLYKDIAKNLPVLRAEVSKNPIIENVMFLSDLPTAPVRAAGSSGTQGNGIRREVEEVYYQEVAPQTKSFHLYRNINFSTKDFDPETTTPSYYIKGNKTKIEFLGWTQAASRTTYASYWDSSGGEAMSLLHSWAKFRVFEPKAKKLELYYLNDKQIEDIAGNPAWIPVEKQMLEDFAKVVVSVGKYGAFKMIPASINDSEVHKALMQHSMDYRATVEQWNALYGSQEDSMFSGTGFGAYMLGHSGRPLINSNWDKFKIAAKVDMVLHPTFEKWKASFRSGDAQRFVQYVESISPLIAWCQMSRSVKSDWQREIASIWDKTPNKIKVTDYLDQILTGKK